MKIGALVPVRLASERLPNKALLPIAGRPAITHLLDRLFASKHLSPERVVVCTTKDSTDDPLVPAVTATGAQVFRGSRDDIIDRFDSAIRAHGFDAVIQADGDDPFTDSGYMDRCMDRLLANPGIDLVMTEGLPLGLNSKAIRATAVSRVRAHRVSEKNDHGFILLFTATGLCAVDIVRPDSPDHAHDDARITLDYQEDLEFFRQLYEAAHVADHLFGVAEIVATLRRRPELVAINAHLNKEYWERTDALLQLQYLRDGVVVDVKG